MRMSQDNEPSKQRGGDSSNKAATEHSLEHNALWDQMTAREGREAAHRAGMKTGDWQAERQLQEALRESRLEGAVRGAARDRKPRAEEKSFIDVGFHAFGTDAVEDGDQSASEHAAPSIVDSSDHHSRDRTRRGASAPNQGTLSEGQAKEDGLPAPEKGGQTEEAEFEDEMEGIGQVEPVVASDLSVAVVPVTPADSEERSGVVHEGRFGKARAAAKDDGMRSRTASGRPNGGGWEERKEASPGRRGVKKASWGAAPNPLPGTSQGVGAGGACRKRAATANPQARRGSGYPRVRGVEADEERKASEGKGEAGKAEGVGDRELEGTDEREMGQDASDEEGEQAIAEPPPFDIMLTLDDDALHRVMLFVHPEDVMECRAVSSRWEFPVHEAVFEGFCRRTYMAQSAKKLLNVKRWRTWQRMFLFRPRLRDTGLYSLKTTYYKKPVRDMSTSWVPGQILECTYYRYFRFFGDGRVAYGLTHETPKEFVRLLQEGSPKVFYGTYTINKWEVKVEMPTPWSHVYFTLQLANGERGRFTHLVMENHSSVPRNDQANLCHHSVKSSDVFTFRRVWQF